MSLRAIAAAMGALALSDLQPQPWTSANNLHRPPRKAKKDRSKTKAARKANRKRRRA